MNNVLRNALIDLSSNLADAGEFGRVAIIDSAIAEADAAAQALDEAREVMQGVMDVANYGKSYPHKEAQAKYDRAAAWLAAHPK